jgi:AcrR family transcriptional regulator
MPKVVAGYKTQARARIVEAAHAVFHRQGFRTATMDDIAKEVGVSKGALYLYFRTKTEILVQVQKQSRTEVLRKWEGLMSEGDIAEGIAHSLDEVFSGNVDPGVWHELAAESATDPHLRDALELDHRDDTKIMRTFLRRLVARGRIPAMEDPEGTADIVLTLLQGTALRVMMRGNAQDAHEKLVRELRIVLGTGASVRRRPR